MLRGSRLGITALCFMFLACVASGDFAVLVDVTQPIFQGRV